MGPFDRFNDRAKRVLALAQDEAIRFNHNYIGPEHLLLGLVREGEGVAARVLDSLGARLSEIRKGVEFTIGRGDSSSAPNDISLHPRSKKIIELAVDEARRLGHSHVGTEHLLLGLVREGSQEHSIASEVLTGLGIDLERVRHQVIGVLGQATPERGPSHPDTAEPLPAHLQEMQKELERIRSEKEAAMQGQQYELASQLRQQERALQEKLAAAKADWLSALNAQGKKDWYCEDVLSGKLKVNVIWEDERVLSFHHPRPEAPVHAVVIPKQHVTSLLAPELLDGALLLSMTRAVQEVARILGLSEAGFQMRSNAIAPGVTPHVHWHVVGPGMPPPRGYPWPGQVTTMAAASSASAGPSGRGPFSRFDQSGKRILALAQDEAIRFNHNYIGTEHLLAALVRGDGVAVRALDDLGVELSKVRTALEFIIGRGDAVTAPSDMTLSPRTKKVLELAVDEADKLGYQWVGSAHILLGLVREGEGIASGILESLGVDLGAVRHRVITLLERPH